MVLARLKRIVNSTDEYISLLTNDIVSSDDNETTLTEIINGVLLKDGSITLDTGYIPTEDLSIATKQYVDTHSGGGGISYATELPMSDTDATFVYDRIIALETAVDSIDLSNYYTNTQVDDLLDLKVDVSTLDDYSTTVEINTLLDTKADVTTVEDLDTRVGVTEDALDTKADVTTVEDLDTRVGVTEDALDTKADIVVQQPSCLTLLSTGTALALPTTYTTITFLENPLLVGTMMTSDLTTVTFTKAGFVDLQITGEVTGAIEVQVLINGAVANLSHFVKITATDTYETLSVDIRRIEVAVDDTIEIQMQSTDGAFNNIILFMRESF